MDKNGLIIERDNFSRIIRRLETTDDGKTVTSYKYNDFGDLIKASVTRRNILLREENYNYEYDRHNNKLMKYAEINIYESFPDTANKPLYTSAKSIYRYKNVYKNDKLIRKTCLYGNTILYMNHYHYRKGNLVSIEKYKRSTKLDLWCVELMEHKSNQIIKSVYLPNGILSHMKVSDLENGVPLNRRIINPAKGKYHWILTACDNSRYPVCSVYVGESLFTVEILLEILNHIVTINELNHDYKLLVIECSDTYIDTSDKVLHEIEKIYRDRGIAIRYSP